MAASDTAAPVWSRIMAPAPSPQPRAEYDATGDAGLWTALAVLDDVLAEGAQRRDGRPRLPSAGAIHPYEVLLLTSHGDQDAVFEIDGARRGCVRLPADPGRWEDVWAAGDLRRPAAGEAHVVVLGRPWLSMRKYGARGYLYASLDAAHLAAALLGTAIARGLSAELRHALPRREIRLLLGPLARYREIHSVVSLSAPRAGAIRPHPPHPWRVSRAAAPAAPAAPGSGLLDDLERLCWGHVPVSGLDGHRTGTGIRRAGLVAPPAAAAAPDVLTEWRALSARRSSSRSFLRRDLPAATLAAAAAAAATALPTDVSDAAEIGMTTFSLGGARESTRNHVAGVCHRQDYLTDAAGFVVFHADRRRLISRERPQALQEALLRSGIAAHLIYLAATSLQVGVTAIGGFDPLGWRTLLGLGPHEDPLYVMALGVEGEGGAKLDRGSSAQGQGQGYGQGPTGGAATGLGHTTVAGPPRAAYRRDDHAR